MYEKIWQEALEGAGGHDCASLSFNLQVQDALEDVSAVGDCSVVAARRLLIVASLVAEHVL